MKTRIKTGITAAVLASAIGANTFAAGHALSNGTFASRREYAYYGYVRLKAVVKNGQLTDVQMVEYPSDNRTSRYINSIALPYLIQEAVQAQSSSVDLISGATFTSMAFTKSLEEALKAAGA